MRTLALPLALVACATLGLGCKDEKKTDVNVPASADAALDASTRADASDASAPTASTPDAEAEAGAEARPTSTDGRDGGTTKKSPDGGLETAGDTDGGAPKKSAGAITLSESSDGKSIEIASGQTLVVMLTATPSSGFDWAVIKSPPALAAPDMGFVSGGDAMGASGKRRLTFVVKSALPAGDHDLVLGYARSFEKGTPPFKTFKVKLHAPR